jgi:hypothetical protein
VIRNRVFVASGFEADFDIDPKAAAWSVIEIRWAVFAVSPYRPLGKRYGFAPATMAISKPLVATPGVASSTDITPLGPCGVAKTNTADYMLSASLCQQFGAA